MRVASLETIREFFDEWKKTVLTFAGYSGAGYEDHAGMLRKAGAVLDEYDPTATLVSIGVSAEGIGAVYELAKARGFETTGIVSSQAQKYDAAVSEHVDYAFFVEDDTWGGCVSGTEQRSPTSQAMVDASDVFVAIGGGEVARDEMLEARRLGQTVRFVAAPPT